MPSIKDSETQLKESIDISSIRISKSVVKQSEGIDSLKVVSTFRNRKSTKDKDMGPINPQFHSMNLNSMVQFENQLQSHMKIDGFKKDKGERGTKILKQA